MCMCNRYKRFSEGHQDVDDNECPGQSSISRTKENVEELARLFEKGSECECLNDSRS